MEARLISSTASGREVGKGKILTAIQHFIGGKWGKATKAPEIDNLGKMEELRYIAKTKTVTATDLHVEKGGQSPNGGSWHTLAKIIETESIMQDSQKKYRKEEMYPGEVRPNSERLNETAKEAASIKHIRPIRDYSDCDYQKIASLFCATTDEKHNVAYFLKTKIFPYLSDADKNDLTILMIGGAGDGRLCKKLVGRIIETDRSVRQFFSDIVIIDESYEAIKMTRTYLEGKFHRVSKEQMQKYGGHWSAGYHEVDHKLLPGPDKKMPLHYEITHAKFPDDKKSAERTGDVVLLNYMLPYSPYEQWNGIMEAAYERVTPGGVLVIPMHELNYSKGHNNSAKSIGLFLNWVGGSTYDIDNVADDIVAVLTLKGAGFSFHLVEGSNLVSDRGFAENLVKFTSLDYPSNLEKIEQHPAQFKTFMDAQQVKLEIEGKTVRLYEIAQQSKIIIASKPQVPPYDQ